MNIWSWVEDTQDELRETGNGRLADLIDRLPSAVLEDANDEVEALVPEALALARSLELPWVEIFVRHWHLQATGDEFEKVPYAVETLELSHWDGSAPARSQSARCRTWRGPTTARTRPGSLRSGWTWSKRRSAGSILRGRATGA